MGIGAFGAARHREKCVRLSTNDLMHLLPGETNGGDCNNKNEPVAARRVECNNQPVTMVICISVSREFGPQHKRVAMWQICNGYCKIGPLFIK